MAQGEKKRTYKITDRGIDSIEHISNNSRMDKSDVVDRAVKYYLKGLVNGDLNDALVDDDIGMPGYSGGNNGGSKGKRGFIDRLRGKDK